MEVGRRPRGIPVVGVVLASRVVSVALTSCVVRFLASKNVSCIF